MDSRRFAAHDQHDSSGLPPCALRYLLCWLNCLWQVDQGEAIARAAVREVLEETGVEAELSTVIGFREVHGTGMGGKSDLFFVCACKALSSEIKIQETEIADAKVWGCILGSMEGPFRENCNTVDSRSSVTFCILHAWKRNKQTEAVQCWLRKFHAQCNMASGRKEALFDLSFARRWTSQVSFKVILMLTVEIECWFVMRRA